MKKRDKKRQKRQKIDLKKKEKKVRHLRVIFSKIYATVLVVVNVV